MNSKDTKLVDIIKGITRNAIEQMGELVPQQYLWLRPVMLGGTNIIWNGSETQLNEMHLSYPKVYIEGAKYLCSADEIHQALRTQELSNEELKFMRSYDIVFDRSNVNPFTFYPEYTFKSMRS